jgi:hypothetical protein
MTSHHPLEVGDSVWLLAPSPRAVLGEYRITNALQMMNLSWKRLMMALHIQDLLKGGILGEISMRRIDGYINFKSRIRAVPRMVSNIANLSMQFRKSTPPLTVSKITLSL